MATWHQMQARRRLGFRLFHETLWTVLYDPPGNMASSMRFTTEQAARAYYETLPDDLRRFSMILEPATKP